MTDFNYNPNEAIRIAKDVLPRLGKGKDHIFSSRYVLSNMKQMKEKAEKLESVRMLWEEAKETNMDASDLIFRLGEILEELE